jgi:hypothetical protein
LQTQGIDSMMIISADYDKGFTQEIFQSILDTLIHNQGIKCMLFSKGYYRPVCSTHIEKKIDNCVSMLE